MKINLEKPKKTAQEKRKEKQDAQLDNVIASSSTITRKGGVTKKAQLTTKTISPKRLGVEPRKGTLRLSKESKLERDYNNREVNEVVSVPKINTRNERLIDPENELEAIYERFGTFDFEEVEKILKGPEYTLVSDTDVSDTKPENLPLEDYQDKILEQEREDKLKDPQRYTRTDWVNNINPSKKSPEGIFRKKWEDNPSIKLRRTNEHADGSQDFMRAYKDGTADYMPANPFIGATFKGDRLSKAEKKAQEKPWLSRLKNIFTINPKKFLDFLDGVKAEKESLADQLGWNEATHEKQEQEYQEHLKNKEVHYDQLAKDWKEDIDKAIEENKKYKDEDEHDHRRAA